MTINCEAPAAAVTFAITRAQACALRDGLLSEIDNLDRNHGLQDQVPHLETRRQRTMDAMSEAWALGERNATEASAFLTFGELRAAAWNAFEDAIGRAQCAFESMHTAEGSVVEGLDCAREGVRLRAMFDRETDAGRDEMLALRFVLTGEAS